tara:strand:- start:229 stop:468 length:240 start_codon:yes stop_codon:yes gene_type:complete
MKYLITTISVIFFANLTIACEFFDKNTTDNANTLMGKKSKFYDAYRQGKCVLEEALQPLPEDQREIIANLIAKTYRLEN